jgi:hypothetical protein
MYVNVDQPVTDCVEITLWDTSFLLGLSGRGNKWTLMVLNVPSRLQPPLESVVPYDHDRRSRWIENHCAYSDVSWRVLLATKWVRCGV